ncbi:hypothetical protein AX14_012171 [Amanita brunnescens Koide BX004]|nr:hypothetical protein AX14_012171 [Amanita brunnescens Koide BX004]
MVGNVISFCLYGALTVQLYIYYISFPNDSRTMRTAIYIIYSIEAMYTGMLAYDMTSRALHPAKEQLTTLLLPVCGGLVTLLTQAVYAHRIWTITRTKFVPLCIIVLMAMDAVLTAVVIPIHVSFYIVSFVWSVTSLVADLTIAVTMVRTLTKDKILSRQLRQRIARLVHVIVGCGILTVAVNIAVMITSLYSLDCTLSCGIVLSKLYANGMMVLINGRKFHSGDDEPSLGDIITFQNGSNSSNSGETSDSDADDHTSPKVT